MTAFAHAGHWAVQLLYLAPIAVLAGLVISGRLKERREARREEERD